MADDRQRIVEVSEETVNMARKELEDWQVKSHAKRHKGQGRRATPKTRDGAIRS